MKNFIINVSVNPDDPDCAGFYIKDIKNNACSPFINFFENWEDAADFAAKMLFVYGYEDDFDIIFDNTNINFDFVKNFAKYRAMAEWGGNIDIVPDNVFLNKKCIRIITFGKNSVFYSPALDDDIIEDLRNFLRRI